MKLSTIVTKATNKIRNPKRHCQFSSANDKFGNPIAPYSKNTYSFCAVGAMRRVIYDHNANFEPLDTLHVLYTKKYNSSIVIDNDQRLNHSNMIRRLEGFARYLKSKGL